MFFDRVSSSIDSKVQFNLHIPLKPISRVLDVLLGVNGNEADGMQSYHVSHLLLNWLTSRETVFLKWHDGQVHLKFIACPKKGIDLIKTKKFTLKSFRSRWSNTKVKSRFIHLKYKDQMRANRLAANDFVGSNKNATSHRAIVQGSLKSLSTNNVILYLNHWFPSLPVLHSHLFPFQKIGKQCSLIYPFNLTRIHGITIPRF